MMNHQNEMSQKQLFSNQHQLWMISPLSSSSSSTNNLSFLSSAVAGACTTPTTTTTTTTSQQLNNAGLMLLNHLHQVAPYSSLSSHSLSSSQTGERTKLFVGNISSDTTLTDLFNLFAPFGDINQQLSVLKDDNYAFIHYYSERCAEEAIRSLNGILFRNRYIRVEYSVSDGHLRKMIKQKTDKKMFYQYKNSKSNYDFNNNNFKMNIPSPQIITNPVTSSTAGLRAIRGGNHRLPTMNTVSNFQAL